jgi:hypothetical protein
MERTSQVVVKENKPGVGGPSQVVGTHQTWRETGMEEPTRCGRTCQTWMNRPGVGGLTRCDRIGQVKGNTKVWGNVARCRETSQMWKGDRSGVWD